MKLTLSETKLKKYFSKLQVASEIQNATSELRENRAPVHVFYGGANLFKSDTPRKLGNLALQSLETYAPNFVEFARAMWLKGADALPPFEDQIQELEFQLIENETKIKTENYAAWLAWTVYNRTVEKLKREAIEDFRIDFEDGYGFRADAEEDAHAISASDELAKSLLEKTITPFCGFRIKSFAPETQKRAARTLDLFLTNFLKKTRRQIPANFVVTLPKITHKTEVAILDEILSEFEKLNKLTNGAIKIEIMIETPQSIVDETGEIALRGLVEAGGERVNSAHFGAFDYTASFGISGVHQHLQHEACNFARQMMQIALAPLNIRLSDSVTTEMPIPIHKNKDLTKIQSKENFRAVQIAWRKHFNNITNSLINGFYQSWDLHPAQLVARYAAVYTFFLESQDIQSKRLKGFIEKASQAHLTGNIFDDAASAQGLLNYFARAYNSGAMSEDEIFDSINLTIEELNSALFAEIMESKQKRK